MTLPLAKSVPSVLPAVVLVAKDVKAIVEHLVGGAEGDAESA
ncbi:MAG: hypothetical protein V9G14_04230 [Cypionkella sp.]